MSAYSMDIQFPGRPPSPIINSDIPVKDMQSSKRRYLCKKKNYQSLVFSNKRKRDNFICPECEESTTWLNFPLNNEPNIREDKYITSNYFKKSFISPRQECLSLQNAFLKRKHCEIEENLKKIGAILMDVSIQN
tara:strand:- start:1776 stop:2177 length:402 start_codon:yes stop_codon:yes gene_type:complete